MFGELDASSAHRRNTTRVTGQLESGNGVASRRDRNPQGRGQLMRRRRPTEEQQRDARQITPVDCKDGGSDGIDGVRGFLKPNDFETNAIDEHAALSIGRWRATSHRTISINAAMAGKTGTSLPGQPVINAMSDTTQTILLWLFILNLGIAFGAGLFEHRIIVPRWLQSSPESGTHWNAAAVRQDDTGRRFWAFTTTVPLTLLTLANLYAAWVSSGPVRSWWLLAAVAASVERVFTFSYFIPTMIGLMGAADSPGTVATATRWASLNYVRHGLGLAAWLAALKSLEVLAQTRRAT